MWDEYFDSLRVNLNTGEMERLKHPKLITKLPYPTNMEGLAKMINNRACFYSNHFVPTVKSQSQQRLSFCAG